MGADLILAATALRSGKQPDWAAAESWIEGLNEESLGNFADIFSLDDEDEDLKERLKGHLADFREGIDDDRWRDLTWITVGPYKVYVSGGMSWGDSPTESFNAINELVASGVLTAAGFDDDQPWATIETIARQILGHAYPDKTFDELTDEEIETVADNLKYADETLAEVMPIVVEGS